MGQGENIQSHGQLVNPNCLKNGKPRCHTYQPYQPAHCAGHVLGSTMPCILCHIVASLTLECTYWLVTRCCAMLCSIWPMAYVALHTFYHVALRASLLVFQPTKVLISSSFIFCYTVYCIVEDEIQLSYDYKIAESFTTMLVHVIVH